jgi:hypothetical protein
MVLHLVDVQQALVVLTGKTFLVIQATGFVALQEVYPNPPVVVAAVAVEIIQQVELVTVLLPMLQILVVLAQLHLQQDFVEATIQAHNIAELLTVLVQVLNKIILALLVFAGTTRILFQKPLVTIRKLATALHNKEAAAVKLLLAAPVTALVQILQILVALVQTHLKQATVVIIILVEMLLHQVLTPITAQPLFKALE